MTKLGHPTTEIAFVRVFIGFAPEKNAEHQVMLYKIKVTNRAPLGCRLSRFDPDNPFQEAPSIPTTAWNPPQRRGSLPNSGGICAGISWGEPCRLSNCPLSTDSLQHEYVLTNKIYQYYRTRRWRKFQTQETYEKMAVVNHGWQGEPLDWPKGDWSCVFAVVTPCAAVTWSVTSSTNAGCSIV